MKTIISETGIITSIDKGMVLLMEGKKFKQTDNIFYYASEKRRQRISGVVLAVGQNGKYASCIKGEFDWPISNFSMETSKQKRWVNKILCVKRC